MYGLAEFLDVDVEHISHWASGYGVLRLTSQMPKDAQRIHKNKHLLENTVPSGSVPGLGFHWYVWCPKNRYQKNPNLKNFDGENDEQPMDGMGYPRLEMGQIIQDSRFHRISLFLVSTGVSMNFHVDSGLIPLLGFFMQIDLLEKSWYFHLESWPKPA